MAKLAKARHILVPSKETCESLKTQIEAGADFADPGETAFAMSLGQAGGSSANFHPDAWCRNSTRWSLVHQSAKSRGPCGTQFGWHLLEVTSRTE